MKIQYELQRSRRKTLSIFILPNAKLLVKAPMHMSISVIEKFILEKSDWIAKKQSEALFRAGKMPKLIDGEVVQIGGKDYTISLIDALRVGCDNKILYLPKSAPKRGLKLFIKRAFLPLISAKTKQIAIKFGLSYREVKLSSANKRWGSCSVDNVVRYSISVALLPERLCDYVVCHELCHTLQKNHGKGFYALLQKMLPDYKQRQVELKEYSALCSFFNEEK